MADASHSITGESPPPWKVVEQNQCRPDGLCVSCRHDVGQQHDVICYSMALARQTWQRESLRPENMEREFLGRLWSGEHVTRDGSLSGDVPEGPSDE